MSGILAKRDIIESMFFIDLRKLPWDAFTVRWDSLAELMEGILAAPYNIRSPSLLRFKSELFLTLVKPEPECCLLSLYGFSSISCIGFWTTREILSYEELFVPYLFAFFVFSSLPFTETLEEDIALIFCFYCRKFAVLRFCSSKWQMLDKTLFEPPKLKDLLLTATAFSKLLPDFLSSGGVTETDFDL